MWVETSWMELVFFQEEGSSFKKRLSSFPLSPPGKDTMKRQQSATWRRALNGTQPCWHPDVGPWDSRIAKNRSKKWRNNVIYKSPSLSYFVTATWSKTITKQRIFSNECLKDIQDIYTKTTEHCWNKSKKTKINEKIHYEYRLSICQFFLNWPIFNIILIKIPASFPYMN